MNCTFKNIDFEIKWWNGEHFKQFAYDTETTLIEKGKTPEYIIGSVYSSKKEVYLLKREDISNFFSINKTSKIWMHNAAFDLAVTQRLLTGSRHLYEVRSVLTDMVEDKRVFDTGLVYQLLMIAKEGKCPQKWALDHLVEIFCHEKIDKGAERTTYGQYLSDNVVDYSSMTDGHLKYAAKDAIATFALARELMKEVPTYDKYNRLLSHDIQLKASIVLAEMGNTPVHVDKERVKALYTATQEQIDILINTMEDYGYNERNYQNKKRRYTYVIGEIEKECGVIIPFEGSEEVQNKNKERQRKDHTQFDMFSGIEQPFLAKSQREEDLYDIKDHPFVEAFIEHQHLKKLQTSFISPSLGKGELYAKWNTMVSTGRTSCERPNLQQLPRSGGFRQCIIPASGNVFVGADYSFIELCTLAQYMFWQQGSSVMKDAINSGVDPHYYTASNVLGKPIEKVSKDERQKAKALNFGIPGGLSASSLVNYAKASYNTELTQEQAEEWRNGLLKTYPDLARYLDVTESECLLPSGRVRGQCTYTTAHNTPFQGMAADGAKLALWELYKHKVTMPIFVHDEIIVECKPEEVNKTAKLLTECMLNGMKQIVPDVKIGVEPFAMERWIKEAETEYDENGNLVIVKEK